MPRVRPSAKDAEAISRRLNHFVHHRYGTWAAFEARFAIARTTRLAWGRRKRPSVPDVAVLIRLARAAQVDLNWLLLGEGPELRRPAGDGPLEQFYGILEAELRASEPEQGPDFEFAWTQVRAHSDIADQHADTVVGLAVDGVRPVFRQIVQWAKQQDALSKLLQPPLKISSPSPQGEAS